MICSKCGKYAHETRGKYHYRYGRGVFYGVGRDFAYAFKCDGMLPDSTWLPKNWVVV